MNETYISNQIIVYKNTKTLVEFLDKLKYASIANYAHIHASGEEDKDGRKTYSLIGITMKDYSKGTGTNSVNVSANLSPEEIKFILLQLSKGVESFNYQQDKIFGDKDSKGYSKVSKVRIIRATRNNKGNPRNLPWYIEVENGKGIKQQNANGGTYMKANSFVSEGKVYANLSDLDMFKLISRVSSYIDSWERAVAPALISNGRNERAKQIAAKRAA